MKVEIEALASYAWILYSRGRRDDVFIRKGHIEHEIK